MTSVIIKPLIPGVLVLLFAAGVMAQTQQTDGSDAPVPADPNTIEVLPPGPDVGPVIPGIPPTPTWQYERTTTNQAGTVQNTHRSSSSGDPALGTEQYQREHVVTNPRGEMVQTWERSQDQDGYQYRRAQTFTAPDGTPLQQHEWTTSGTDPYNYTREHQHQLRDGRTITHRQTRSWDGTTGTMEQSFVGPNGQTRELQRPWAPDELSSPEPGPIVSDSAGAAAPPTAQPRRNRWGWVEKLNLFRKGGPFRPTTPSPQRQAGFTIGSGGASSTARTQPGLNKSQPGNPSPNSRRPSWAGLHGGPPSGAGAASLPSPRGHNR